MALTQVDQGLLGQYAQYTGFKNRIINGAMVISQRGGGSTSTGFLNQIDQFSVGNNIAATFTYQQSSDAPAGFKNSALVTITGTATAGATDYLELRNKIEGYNIADMGFGASGASTVTLSFWVKSSLTGTFGGSLNNSAFDYCFPFSYAINSANTWEFKTVTITGATAGTWLTTNGVGFSLMWSLGLGSTYLGTAGAWVASRKQGVTGQVQMCQTNGATFQLTGVQLEKGSTATSFDYRPYGTELSLCQRYYYYAGVFQGAGYQDGATAIQATFSTPVPMRATPTLTTAGTTYIWRHNGYSSQSSPSNTINQYNGCSLLFTISGYSGGVNGYVANYYSNITCSAEL